MDAKVGAVAMVWNTNPKSLFYSTKIIISPTNLVNDFSSNWLSHLEYNGRSQTEIKEITKVPGQYIQNM